MDAGQKKAIGQGMSEQGKKESPQKRGDFVNIVLLGQAEWDKKALEQELKEHWKLTVKPDAKKAEPDTGGQENTLAFGHQGAGVVVKLVPEPAAGDMVEKAAKRNYTWRNAVLSVKRQCAQLFVMVTPGGLSAMEAGTLLVKVVAACCAQPGVLGVFANGTVYQKEQYQHYSGMARAGVFPVQDLIWMGHYNGKKGLCGYTLGLRQFGYDEIEILNSSASEQELDDFLLRLTNHIVYHDVVLKHGEIIGFQAWHKLAVTRSRGGGRAGGVHQSGIPACQNDKAGFCGLCRGNLTGKFVWDRKICQNRGRSYGQKIFRTSCEGIPQHRECGERDGEPIGNPEPAKGNGIFFQRPARGV